MAENGNGNGNGLWTGMPWWVRAVALVGVPALITVAAFGFLAADVRAAQASILANQATILANQRHIDEDGDRLREVVTQAVRIWRQTCLNTAKTELQIKGCTE